MSIRRLIAILFIFVVTAVAWFALGTSLVVRTGEHDTRLGQEVARLWGGPQQQVAPTATVARPVTTTEHVSDTDAQGRAVAERSVTRTSVEHADAPLIATRAVVDLALDERQRGLLWYATYAVRFRGHFTFRNPDAETRTMEVRFALPNATGVYDDVTLKLDGRDVAIGNDLSKGIATTADVAPGGEARLEVAYRSRGLGTWTYAFARDQVAQVRDFALTMTTDVENIDFPVGTVSPSSKRRAGDGWTLDWTFANLVAGLPIGVELPHRPNPGPLASRITFFAPVSLLFFLTVLVMLGVTRGPSLHPMHYFFLAAAFFAFHLLLAYLVDHVSIHVAFGVAAATSVALVVSYLRVAAGARGMAGYAAVAQAVFLVLFSYAFFFEGYAGLTVTVGGVLTLFVLMQTTARVDWDVVFGEGPAAPGGAGRVLAAPVDR